MAQALAQGDLDAAELTSAERILLQWVALLTRSAYRATDGDVQRLRQAGWTEPQIAEATYVTGLFALMNRVADAFGLQDPGYL